MKTELMEKQLLEEIPASTLFHFVSTDSLAGYLNHLMGRRNISTDVFAGLADLNRASLYKILNGSTKNPFRNVLLRLSLAMQLSFQDTQMLLKLGGCATLSGDRKRDILISDGIIHKRPIDEINVRLQRHRFDSLYEKE